MQFIEGKSLAELIAAPRQQGADTSGSPTGVTAPAAAASTEAAPRDAAYFRRVAEWGIQAAEALEHAHALGIVHRDVKPANLIVDGQGKLWVTDFGLARTVTDAGLTMTGDLLGTLRYMSPEQALARHGLVDHRTDIYSLGATLYELLAGRPAVEGQDRQEILRRIADEEPRPLRSIDGVVPADLETIVLKALGKEPDERYATARELADDLRRFLEDRPIRAHRPTALQRGQKWLRRHRAVARAALGVLIVIVLGLTISTCLIWQSHRETKAALARADAKNRWARRAVNDMYTRVAEDWLENEPHLTEVQQDFLRRAMDFYKELAAEDATDPDERLEMGLAYRRMARLAVALGDERESRDQVLFRQALAVFRQLAHDHPDERSYLKVLAESEVELGKAERNYDRFEQAEELIARGRRQFAQLALAWPGDLHLQYGIACADHEMGELWRRTRRTQGATESLTQAAQEYEGLVRRAPEVARYRLRLAQTYLDLTQLLEDDGRLTEATRYADKAIVLLEQLVAGPRPSLSARNGLGASYHSRGYFLTEIGDFAAAQQDLERSLRLREQNAADYPNHIDFQHSLSLINASLGRLMTALDRPRDAEVAFQAAVRYSQRILDAGAIGHRQQETAIMHAYLAWLHASGPAAVRDPDQALRDVQLALGLGPQQQCYLTTLLGLVYYRRGEWEQAVNVLQRVEAGVQKSPAPPLVWTTDCVPLCGDAADGEAMALPLSLFVLAMSHQRRHEPEQARANYHRARECLATRPIRSRHALRELEMVQAEAATLLEVAP
jgi:tetratricopeptide (TPR) repeat protein